MYYPLQIPNTLNKELFPYISYTEEIVESLQDFVICIWQSKPLSNFQEEISATSVIVADGCIDLVVFYDSKKIGYSGMSKTNFNYSDDLSSTIFGARLKPGAFEQLTNVSAKKVMDTFLSLETIDASLDIDHFFSLKYDQAKEYFIGYLHQLVNDKLPNKFVTLFDELSKNPMSTPKELYEKFNFNPLQCQRSFKKHFGIAPQTVLSIVRFQYCLRVLTSGEATPSEILELVAFYDQSHFIKDFKKNLGLTPFEYLRVLEE